MSLRARWTTLVVALVTLIGVATPAVVENHTEAGFCSADCPVQHDSHGTAITPPLAPWATPRTAAIVIASVRGVDVGLDPVDASDAPRAPPSA